MLRIVVGIHEPEVWVILVHPLLKVLHELEVGLPSIQTLTCDHSVAKCLEGFFLVNLALFKREVHKLVRHLRGCQLAIVEGFAVEFFFVSFLRRSGAYRKSSC